MRLRLMSFGLILLCASCAFGPLNLQEGIRHFQEQDYRQAFIRLKPEAEKGQPDAQYAIGYMYYYGQGVLEDRKQAWYWITRAAEAGQADAKTAVQVLQRKSG